MEAFAQSFFDADELIISEIDSAGETPIPGVTAGRLAEAVQDAGHPAVVHIPEKREIVFRLLDRLRPGDWVLTLGAGDIHQVADQFLTELKDA